MNQCYDIAPTSLKSRRLQYGKIGRSKKDKMGQKSRKSYQRDNINPIIRKNSKSEANVYYHIIYKY